MHYESLISPWKQRFGCATCAVAFVGSLALYHRTVLANPVKMAQRHWQAIASENPFGTRTQYCADAIMLWNYGSVDKVYQGEEIYRVWHQFFKENKIQQFQVVEKPYSLGKSPSRRGSTVKAEITLRALPDEGPVKVFYIFYKAHFDERGKITHEVWQAHPELTV